MKIHIGAHAIVSLLSAWAIADSPATRPAPAQADVAPPGATSLLIQLSHETQNLFKEVRPGVVRVQMPLPLWAKATTLAPLNRWDKLNPEMRRQLTQQWRGGPAGRGGAATRPAPSNGIDRAAAAASSVPQPPSNGSLPTDGQGPIIFVTPSVDSTDATQKNINPSEILPTEAEPKPRFEPHNVGMVLDDRGHVLVPLFVEAEACANVKLLMASESGEVVEAKFIGSDKQTNLTLLQAVKPLGKALPISKRPVDNGALVIYFSLTDALGRLAMWDSRTHDSGLVFTVDGRAAGLVRNGQLLSSSACTLIADQIIRFGSVKRASMGVIVSEMQKDDPLLEQFPKGSGHTAMHIDEVLPNSPASRAGIKANDLLISLAGDAVTDVPSFAAAIAVHRGPTEIQIFRDNRVMSITVDLEAK